MPVPTYDQFIEPLFRHLASKPDGSSIADAYAAVAKAARLTEADLAELLPSGGQAVFRNRIGWAHDRLKRNGYSASPRRGFWKLTPDGVAFAAKNKKLSSDQSERIANVGRNSRLKQIAGGASPIEPPSLAAALDSAGKSSPEERIEAALGELRESVARDLLENIGRSPPEFFEQLVLELLHAMGYGASKSDVQRVGGSGDGGIDGIISLDRLGLEKVYVQAKRWKGVVGSPEIQTFMGALQLQSAAKGVFITTSTFTKDARAAAGRARGVIVLVDGKRLTELMIDHGVAVSHKALRVPKVDNDYFGEG